jgi:hypothetical protein
MELYDLLLLIAPEWRTDFVRFAETGAASDDLLAYLDSHEHCRELIEFVFPRTSTSEGTAAAAG